MRKQTTAIHEAMYSPFPDRVQYNLFLNFGIGGSLIDGNRVIRGAFGQASNIGAMVPETGPRPSLVDLADALSITTEALDLAEIEQRTGSGDPVILDWIRTRGAMLSEPLSAVVHLFNPSAIVVSGLFTQNVIDGLISNIDLGVYDLPGRVELAKPDLRPGTVVGPDSMAISAAAVPIYQRFAPHHDGSSAPEGGVRWVGSRRASSKMFPPHLLTARPRFWTCPDRKSPTVGGYCPCSRRSRTCAGPKS